MCCSQSCVSEWLAVVVQKAVPDSVKDEAASQYYVNPITILGLMDTAAVPKVRSGQYES